MYGIKLSPYAPTEKDIQFTKQLVGSLPVGGRWGIPRCCIFYEKTSENSMKLENYLIPDLATHMIKANMAYEGMEKHASVEDLKKAQAKDHQAFKACCDKLGIEVDDSILDGQGHR